MVRVYLVDALSEERSALRLLLLDLEMEVVGEAGDWSTLLAEASTGDAEMLLVNGDLFPGAPSRALDDLHIVRPTATIIILFKHLDIAQQEALASPVNVFISKYESPERIIDRLRDAASNLRSI